MVPETDFPDIRNRCAIHSHNGSCMIIPREGDLIRLYIQLSDKDVLDPSSGRVDRNKMGPEMLLEVIFFGENCRSITIEWCSPCAPIQGGQEVIPPIQDRHPRSVRMVHDIYQCALIPASTVFALTFARLSVGQRVASRFSVQERVFIVGDACHTHSPKAGKSQRDIGTIYHKA